MLVGSWVRDKLKILDFPPLNLVDYFNSTSFRTVGLDGFILASIKQKRDQLEEGQLIPSQYIKLGGETSGSYGLVYWFSYHVLFCLLRELTL